jgi:glycerol-3-phosphate cytidylyltransferase-like family protein
MSHTEDIQKMRRAETRKLNATSKVMPERWRQDFLIRFGIHSGHKRTYKLLRGAGRMEINFYQVAREKLEQNILTEKPIAPETERKNLYAGLAAFTVAVENHLNQILRAIEKTKD